MRLVLVALLALAIPCFADGPGTRILTTPSGPQRPDPAAERDLQRCEALSGEEKERCTKDVRAAITAGDKQRGPEAAGAGLARL
jgi:hypothetical protein